MLGCRAHPGKGVSRLVCNLVVNKPLCFSMVLKIDLICMPVEEMSRGIKLLELRQPIVSDERAFRAAVAEFRSYDPDWTFAFHFDEKTDFAKYVQKVRDWSEGKDLGEFVPNTFLVAVVSGTV